MPTPTNRLPIVLCLVAACVAGTGGCPRGREADSPRSDAANPGAAPAPVPTHEEVAVLDMSVALWNQAKNDEATAMLLRLTDPGAKPCAGTSPFAATAEVLRKLSPAERAQKQEEILQNARTLKLICKQAVDTGTRCLEKKDFRSAEQWFVAVRECGSTIAGPNTMTRLDGLAIQKLALRNLVLLYEQLGDQTKLQEARGKLSGL